MKTNSWLSKIKSIFLFQRKKAPSKQLIDLLDTPEENSVWWGSFLVDNQQSRYSKIGNIIVCIDNYNHEWQLDIYRESNLTQTKTKTLGTQLSTNEINLKPALPDRTLHAKLLSPLVIPPDGSITLYLSTPIWIRIEIGAKPIALDEIPTHILADTWWGKNTVEGELCYAANPMPSLRSDDLPQDPTHVMSMMFMHNQSRDRIFLQDIRLPLPFLSIFCDERNHLWTEQVNVIFDQITEPTTVITPTPPKELNNPTLISHPRIAVKPSFKHLFNYLRGQ